MAKLVRYGLGGLFFVLALTGCARLLWTDEELLYRPHCPLSFEKVIEFLGSDNVEHRRQAAKVLGNMSLGKQNEKTRNDVFEALVKAVDDEDKVVMYNAVESLTSQRLEIERALPIFIGLLERDDSGSIYTAADAIERYAERGDDVSLAIPLLIQALDREDIYEYIVWCLARIGPPAIEAYPILLSKLKEINGKASQNDSRLQSTLYAMARISLEDAIPILEEITQSADEDEVDAGFDCIKLIGPLEPVINLLRLCVLNDAHIARISAIEVLGHFGPSAAAAAPDLISALEEDNQSVQFFAARALGHIGPVEGVVEALSDVLKSDCDLSVKEQAIVSLGLFGPDARESLPFIREALLESYALPAELQHPFQDSVNQAIVSIDRED